MNAECGIWSVYTVGNDINNLQFVKSESIKNISVAFL